MLDKWTSRWVQPPLKRLARRAAARGLHPDQLTLAGFVIGMLALPLLAWGQFGLALIAILINRVVDGLDGALARHAGLSSDAGGFLDICLDFLFYAAVVVGFALADPSTNAMPAVALLFAFVGTGSSFLAFAIMAAKHQIERPNFTRKAFYYLDGLTEGTETIGFFVLACLMPQHFAWLAWIFAGACILTAITRVWGGYVTLRARDQGEQRVSDQHPADHPEVEQR